MSAPLLSLPGLLHLWATAYPPVGSKAVTVLVEIIAAGFAALLALAVAVPKKRPPAQPFARRASPPSGRQLRHDPNARLFWDRCGFLLGKRHWFEGTGCPPLRLSEKRMRCIQDTGAGYPARIAQANGRTWWRLDGKIYWESGGYRDADVLALVRDRERKDRKHLERAHLHLNIEHQPRKGREHIPVEVRRAVFNRDGGQCRQCGERFDLQYDHILPVALGGATSVENLQLLCGECNRAKGADI